MSDGPRITIVGGGLAGMTAALRLAEQGYRVKLYEQKSMLGGNLASRKLATGGIVDVYPHMYLGWYKNFWRMMKDVGVSTDNFTPFTSVKQLARGAFPHFTALQNGYTLRQILENVSSGVGPPEDMFIFGYASIDLLAELMNPTVRLQNMSLSGFLNARPYMTDVAAEAYETYITRVWAIPAYLVSAKDCRTYLRYCFAEANPEAWLARGPAASAVIAPLEAALESAGVEIELSVEVTEVTRAGDRVSDLRLRHTKFDPASYRWLPTGEAWTETVDDLLLAVPAPTLARLVRGGKRGTRVVEVDEDLSELARMRTQRVPILHLFFKKKLEKIPAEPVGLFGSKLNLAFTDISQTWRGVPEFTGKTVLAISCSEPYVLTGAHPNDNGHEILLELAEYLNFQPGTEWRESPDIDWTHTRYHENFDTELSLNAIGTDAWRPSAMSEEVSNLYFAGDFCIQDIGLSTIEAAVASGLEAVNAIVRRRNVGSAIEVLKPDRLPDSLYVGLRYAWGPYAMAAKGLSMINSRGRQKRPSSASGDATGSKQAASKGAESLLTYLLTPGLPARGQRRDS
jgi:hypothetical protein